MAQDTIWSLILALSAFEGIGFRYKFGPYDHTRYNQKNCFKSNLPQGGSDQ